MDDDTHSQGDDSPSHAPAGASRRQLVGWLVAALVLMTGLVALAGRIHERGSGMDVAAGVLRGDRMPAPRLQGRRITGVDNPGLPRWWTTPTKRDDQVMVVNFWASWCGPCREESPMLQDVAEAYADRGVVVVGADPASEDAMSDARAFIDEFDLTYPMVRIGRDVKEGWGINGFPETWVIGRDHRVAARVPGPIDGRSLRSLIDRELERS